MTVRDAAGWLNGKTLEDLQAIEQGQRLLFPDKIQRRQKDGTLVDVDVVVRVPRVLEKQQARADAVRIFKKQGLDREKDEDLFGELDTLCVLQRAIRDPKPPHDQHEDVETLLATYDVASLLAVWERLRVYDSMLDPRISAVTEEEIVAATLAIDRVRNLSPLAAMDASAIDSCIVGMASRLAIFLRLSSSSKPTQTSTPAS